MGRTRRSGNAVRQLAEQAKALVDGGSSIKDAIAQVGIGESVYRRHAGGRKRRSNGAARPKGGRRGSIDVRSLPPRPRRGHGGARRAKPINMNDVGRVANRIAVIDRKLARLEPLRIAMTDERRSMAKRLMKLLDASG